MTVEAGTTSKLLERSQRLLSKTQTQSKLRSSLLLDQALKKDRSALCEGHSLEQLADEAQKCLEVTVPQYVGRYPAARDSSYLQMKAAKNLEGEIT